MKVMKELKSLRRLANDVFGSKKRAAQWFEDEVLCFSYKKPIDMMREEGGAGLVRDTLLRIEYGVYF